MYLYWNEYILHKICHLLIWCIVINLDEIFYFCTHFILILNLPLCIHCLIGFFDFAHILFWIYCMASLLRLIIWFTAHLYFIYIMIFIIVYGQYCYLSPGTGQIAYYLCKSFILLHMHSYVLFYPSEMLWPSTFTVYL